MQNVVRKGYLFAFAAFLVILAVFVVAPRFLWKHSGQVKDSPIHLIELGNEKRFSGDQDSAIKLYDEAVMLDSTSPTAYNMRGFSYMEKPNYQKAFFDFSKAVELDPKDSIYRNNLANVLVKLNKTDDARKQYDESIHLKPNNIKAHIDRGCFRNQQGDYKGAAEDFEQASKIPPPYSSVYTIEYWEISEQAYIYKLLGDSLIMLEKYKEAEDAYTKAIDETPKYPQAYEGRAEAKDHLGDKKGSTVDRAMATKIRNDPNKHPEMTKKDLLRSIFK